MSLELVEKIKSENEPLFEASRMNIRHYFNGPRTKDELISHFVGRAANEYLNLVGISKAVSQMPPTTPIEELQLISKQAHDEANHFRWVKEVVNHIAGGNINIDDAITKEFEKDVDDRGANLIARYGAENDEVMLAVYQLVAEGRAHAAWQQMADMNAVDETVANYYAKIARDEKFHASIGEEKLKKMNLSPEKEQEVLEFVSKIRKELFFIICGNSCEAPGAYDHAAEAYGWEPREQVTIHSSVAV